MQNVSRLINFRQNSKKETNGIDVSLEWKIVVGRRRFTSGHRMVGGEEEDRNDHGSTK